MINIFIRKRVGDPFESYSSDFWDAFERLGAESEVIIDRPKGSRHPKWGKIYPVDYGYLANTASRARDGEVLISGEEPILPKNLLALSVRWI